MTVFRITTEQWSKRLTASGYPARWNTRGTFIIYTAQSRALACLENIVHRSGVGDNSIFKVMLIDVPPDVKIQQLETTKLKINWAKIQNYGYCQAIGDQWVRDGETAIMRVPSAIINEEYNYLINPNHPEFSKIKFVGNEPFGFDSRI